MATQTKNPGTGADLSGVGTIAWSSTANALSSNNQYAQASLGSSAISHYLKLTDFGFTLPPGITINRIQVDIERKASNASSIKDYIVSLVKGGVVQSENKASASYWSTLDSVVSYLFNVTGWTQGDLNASNFGIVISVKNYGGSLRAAYVDAGSITIDYSATSINLSPTKVASRKAVYGPKVTQAGNLYPTRVESRKEVFRPVLTTFIVIPPVIPSRQWVGSPKVMRDEILRPTMVPSRKEVFKPRIPTTWEDESAVTPTTWEDD